MDVSGNTIRVDFFPFSTSPYYTTYPQDGVAGNYEFTCEEWDTPYRPTFGVLTKEVFKDPTVCKPVVDQFPTPSKIVRIEALFEYQLTTKMSVLHCMMMSHGGELLARYCGLLQSYHEYVQLADSRLKGYEERVAGAKGKKIKSLTKSLDNLHAEVARLSVALNQATVLGAEKDEEILRLKITPSDRVQCELLSLADNAGFERSLSMHPTKDEFATVLNKMANFMLGAYDRLAEASPLDARVSPPTTKESTVTLASKSLELSANVDLTASIVASEHNEEMVNAEVDGSDPQMTDDTVATKFGHAFVQGISFALQDAVELVEEGSGHASSSPNDVVVAFFVGEKGDSLVPSSAAGEGAASNSSRV
ncbi:hypothetical protein Tco_1050948 [Tanacetum coccineum]